MWHPGAGVGAGAAQVSVPRRMGRRPSPRHAVVPASPSGRPRRPASRTLSDPERSRCAGRAGERARRDASRGNRRRGGGSVRGVRRAAGGALDCTAPVLETDSSTPRGRFPAVARGASPPATRRGATGRSRCLDDRRSRNSPRRRRERSWGYWAYWVAPGPPGRTGRYWIVSVVNARRWVGSGAGVAPRDPELAARPCAVSHGGGGVGGLSVAESRREKRRCVGTPP